MDLNSYFWLLEQEVPAMQAPTSDSNTGATAANQGMPTGVEPEQQEPVEPQQELPKEEENFEDDPTDPDMPDDDEEKSFDQWQKEFFELSIKGDPSEMLLSMKSVREQDLMASQKKFIDDNFQICMYRQDANIAKASKEIRALIKEDINTAYPGTTIMQHITKVLEKEPVLQQNLIKLTGFYALKGELHRKFLAGLLGAVQVGGGNRNTEDLIFSDVEYTTNISTRFYTQFGDINLGAWELKETDPEEILSEPEMERLEEGSPEEKQVLRRRIMMESISQEFDKRAFIVHIVAPDGTIFSLGYDLGTSMLAAYEEGKLVLRSQKNETRNAQINAEGDIIPIIDIDILYVKPTGEVDEHGKPEMTEVPFIKRRDSVLYLSADADTLRDATNSMSGIFFREVPYPGNPSDIKVLQRCIPDLAEMLNRRCLGATFPEDFEKRKKF